MPRSPRPPRSMRTRTCVGCGVREDPRAGSGLVRVVARDTGIEFDLSSRAAGRGAYVHARPTCLDKAPRALARALGGRPRSVPSEPANVDLRTKLSLACHRRIAGLLVNARRVKSVHVEPWLAEPVGAARLSVTVVAADAGSLASSASVLRAIKHGRAFAWGSQRELGALLGATTVAACTVSHESLAAELIRTRAAADAASAATTKEAMQRSRRPEAR